MHVRRTVPPDLARLAAHQDRAVTREQALALGLARHAVTRLVEEGFWCALARGVYCVEPRPDWRTWAWAGVLIGGDRARLGGAAAGYLHGIVERPPESIMVLIPASGGRPRIAGPWQFVRERSGVRSPGTRGSPPRVGVEDAVLDLADDTDSSLAEIITCAGNAVQLRRTTPLRLRRALAGRPRIRRRRLLVELFEEVSVGVRSPLERRYLQDVERPHGLPTGIRQPGQAGTEVDVWYRNFDLLVELDGRRGHEGLGRFRDLHRDNRSTTRALATLRYGLVDLAGTPCLVARQVAENLILRGWTGVIEPCPHCRLAA